VILTTAGLFIGFAIGLGFYLGAQKNVLLSESTSEPMYLVYKEHLGPYHQIEATIESVESWAKSQHIACERTSVNF